MNASITRAPWLPTDMVAALAAEYLAGPSDERAISAAYWLADVLRSDSNVFEVEDESGAEYILTKSPHRVWAPTFNSEPYADFDEMAAADLAGEDLLVSDLFHDHPVFDRVDNLRFRAWHDAGHLDHGLGFEPGDELALFWLQARQFTGPRAASLVAALFSESVYQLAACMHLGGFPDVQVVRTPGPVARQLLADMGLAVQS